MWTLTYCTGLVCCKDYIKWTFTKSLYLVWTRIFKIVKVVVWVFEHGVLFTFAKFTKANSKVISR